MMSLIKYILRSLWHYRRSNLLLVAAVAVTSCLLTGALLLGNAMRTSLDALVAQRLGRVERVVHAPAGYFRAGLADSLRAAGPEAAAVIVTEGTVSMTDDPAGTVPVTVYGVDSAFFAFGSVAGAVPAGSRVLVNRTLARYGFEAGSRIRLQVTPYRPFTTDSYMASRDDDAVSFACVVRSTVPDSGMGRFSIRQVHYDRPAVFVERRALARRMEVRGRANLVLLGAGDSAAVHRTLRRAWRPADHGYELVTVRSGHAYELHSERVFIPAAEGDALLGTVPAAYGVNTYFINTISKGYTAVPYSFVSTANALVPPRSVPDGEIILNDWTAGRLFAHPGDTVQVDYFVEQPGGGLDEASAVFRVHDVVPVNDSTADPDLMPRFPGFSGALECRYWDPGVPIDMDRISDADERYWADWQGTPKAFVSSGTFRATWPSRYGAYTALRFPADSVLFDDAEAAVRRVLTPERGGITFMDLRAEGRTSVDAGIDFGQLFLGLSFFIIAAALMLVVLLFGLAVEQRSAHTATLRALGFTRAAVARLYMAEGVCIGIIGALAGSALGIRYQQVLLWALNRFWQDITTSFRVSAATDYGSLAAGVLATVALVPLAQWLALRLNRGTIAGQQRSGHIHPPFRRYGVICLACSGALAATAVYAVLAKSAPLPVFFVMGVLFIAATLAGVKYAVARAGAGSTDRISTAGLVRGFMAYRGNRSVLLMGILQAGTFIVLTIGLHHRATFRPAQLETHGSGSGGFSLIGESALRHTDETLKPFEKALNHYCYGTVEQGNLMRGRVRDGDDASCLNITRARRPKVIGVDTRMLQARKSFGFAALSGGIAPETAWRALELPLAPGVYPAAADQTVMTWGLGMGIGDTLRYVNSRGEPVRLVLVAGLENSVFQGAVLVSGPVFRKAFPAEAGYSFFLMDTYDGAGADSAYAALQRVARRSGIFITRTADRLQGFAEVQNTYLAVFFVLGGFGLLLGCAGVGIVIVKTAAERRYEYALLHAVGFRTGTIRRLLWVEHLVLLALGIGTGAAAALVTAIPTGGASGGDFPLPLLVALTGGLLVNGILWITVASLAVGRNNMAAGLRTE